MNNDKVVSVFLKNGNLKQAEAIVQNGFILSHSINLADVVVTIKEDADLAEFQLENILRGL
jgi:hypothetical protein